MKLNAKDVASGVILILFAAVGLWLNQDHPGLRPAHGPGLHAHAGVLDPDRLGIIVLGLGLRQRARSDGEVDRIDSARSRSASSPATAPSWSSRRMFSSFFETSYGSLGLGMLVGFLVICWSPALAA